jgi:hypothetical protein
VFSLNVFGTAQIPDILIYNGDTLSLFSCPLDSYPDKGLINPKILFGSSGCFYTACWRNYVATWTIDENKLYLVSIRNACYPTGLNYVAASYNNGSETPGKEFADLELLFPGRFKDGRVVADWYTGTMISPSGKLLYYVHDGFSSIFEKETEFSLERGVLSNIREFNNSKTRKSKYTEKPELVTEFIQNNIDYSVLPETNERIRVIISIISSDDEGKIDSVRILRGYNEIFNREAVRVVKSIPDWEVIYRHGKRIYHSWVVPVIFEKKNKSYTFE